MRAKLMMGCALAALALAGLTLEVQAQSYPRTLVAQAEITGPGGKATTTITIHIERLMLEHDYKTVAAAMEHGGYPNFLPALRKLPAIGYVEVGGGKRTELKYARAREGKITLTLGTDRPIFFIGGGSLDAKPKAGYEVGVIDLNVDAAGNGEGLMAAAARVKRGPDGGIILDDYAATPITLKLKPAK